MIWLCITMSFMTANALLLLFFMAVRIRRLEGEVYSLRSYIHAKDWREKFGKAEHLTPVVHFNDLD